MANEQRLIDANALIENSDVFTMYTKEYGSIEVIPVDAIGDAPTVEAVEVVHGRWIRKQVGKYNGVDEVCCSNCGSFIGVVFSDTGFEEAVEGMNYCNNCGTKMDGDGNG